MAAYNHNLAYRPIRGGVAILNPQVNEPGTLGCLLTSDGDDRWILSCYHVLGRVDGSAFPDGEHIFQPGQNDGVIARNSSAHSNWNLDCSAAILQAGVASSPEIVGLSILQGSDEPQVGMRVMKSGAETGITEGVITALDGDTLEIGVNAEFDPNYELSARGDSGAVWIARDTGKVIGLHRAATSYGSHVAIATRISSVLNFLKMRIAT